MRIIGGATACRHDDRRAGLSETVRTHLPVLVRPGMSAQAKCNPLVAGMPTFFLALLDGLALVGRLAGPLAPDRRPSHVGGTLGPD